MKPTSLEHLYAKFTPVAGNAPPAMQRELGQFDVFSLGNLRPGYSHRPPMPFNRQAFYKISLTHGRGRIEYADHLGFADVAHFCTFFKRHTGLRPGDFRG